MSISSLNASTNEHNLEYMSSPQLSNRGKFINDRPVEEFSWSKVGGLLKRYVFESKQNASLKVEVPVKKLSLKDIQSLPDNKISVIRLGHSSVLFKLNNQLWLIDPVFSERASPFSFFGPKRFHGAPIALDQLPEIDGVIISHNHYDHMDEYTIKTIHSKVKQFVMPLGNAAQLSDWGVPKEKLVELDWWQSVKTNGLELVATPAQHFSGRGLSDRDHALWSSWVIKSDETKLFYSGDSGYFKGFKEIGDRYGPFDLTIMENGAYDKDWPEVHMSPKETAQAHLDLKGRKLLPVHNGTFDLAFHSWVDPFEQIVDIANMEWIDVLTPTMGQVITLGDEASVDAARDLFWWR